MKKLNIDHQLDPNCHASALGGLGAVLKLRKTQLFVIGYRILEKYTCARAYACLVGPNTLTTRVRTLPSKA